MGKIWLKSVDPNKQCCGCEGKSGPCDSCCIPTKKNNWTNLYAEGEFKDKLLKLGDSSGEFLFNEQTNLLKITNDENDFGGNDSSYFNYKFLLSISKNEVIELSGEILPPNKKSNFISNFPAGQTPPFRSQLLYENASSSKIVVQGDYLFDSKRDAFVSYEIEGEAIEDVSYSNSLSLPTYSQLVFKGDDNIGFTGPTLENVRDGSALYINFLNSQNNNSPFFTQVNRGSNVSNFWYSVGSSSSITTNYSKYFSLDFSSRAAEIATTYDAFWHDFFITGPNFYNVGYIPPIYPSFIDEGVKKTAKIRVTSIKKILYAKDNPGLIISETSSSSACVNVICNKNNGIRILSSTLSPLNIKSRLRSFSEN